MCHGRIILRYHADRVNPYFGWVVWLGSSLGLDRWYYLEQSKFSPEKLTFGNVSENWHRCAVPQLGIKT